MSRGHDSIVLNKLHVLFRLRSTESRPHVFLNPSRLDIGKRRRRLFDSLRCSRLFFDSLLFSLTPTSPAGSPRPCGAREPRQGTRALGARGPVQALAAPLRVPETFPPGIR